MTRFGRLSGKLAGQRAIRVYVCGGCEAHIKAEKPAQCPYCGRIDFESFASVGEAQMWGQLRTREKRGQISNLKRQTRHKLLAYGADGQPVEVGVYTDDASFIEDGVLVTLDHKPSAGMDPLAALKIKIMAANGRPVTIHIRR